MSTATTHTTETEERKPPTLADIVREKTDDGARIIDFFLDVMEGRIDGAELCHRIDSAKQLVKYGSEDAVTFIAKYKGVPCGHSTRDRLDPAHPCSTEDRSLVEVTLNAPPTLTREFLTVLSGIDEFLMRQLIRAQTADGGTIIDFLYDVMQDTTDGFRTHHRIAAAKELIVHIARDEHDSHTPSPSTREGRGEGDSPEPSRRSEGDSPVVPAQPEGNPDNLTVVPAEAGTQGRNLSVVPEKSGTHPSHPALSSIEEPADNLTVVPEKSLPRTRYGAGTHPRDPEPGSQPETKNSKLETHPGRSPPS